jgi:hypothetical protein
MKTRLFWSVLLPGLLAMIILLGVSRSDAQSSINGPWLFDVSGVAKGGVIIEFVASGNTGALTGYGLTLEDGFVVVSGNYILGAKNTINGTISSPGGNLPFSGKIDKTFAKITLKIQDGPTLKGVRLPHQPVIPEAWTAKATGGATLDLFEILPVTSAAGLPPGVVLNDPDDYVGRVFSFSGEGFVEGDPWSVDGFFFLDSKSTAYGVFKTLGAIGQTGALSGKINLSSGSFSFKAMSDTGENGTIKGKVK